MNRWPLVTLMMTFSLFACATDKQTKRWTLADTLKVMQRVTAEQDLLAEIGEPHKVDRFNPGTPGDPYPPNWSSRERWKNERVFFPDSLIDRLAVGTRIINYGFGATNVGGGLLVYVDDAGKVLGYSYSKSLVGLETEARMDKRP
jgi:hypothetical protein